MAVALEDRERHIACLRHVPVKTQVLEEIVFAEAIAEGDRLIDRSITMITSLRPLIRRPSAWGAARPVRQHTMLAAIVLNAAPTANEVRFAKRRGVEHRRRFLELVPAAGVAEADDLALVKRQTVRADRIAGPGAMRVDAILEAKVVRH